MKTRNVDKQKYRNYLKKADEYFQSMNQSFVEKHYNATVLNAIHCAISAADALTVFYKGVRHAGERHEDVVSLLNTLGLAEIEQKNRQLLRLLQLKNSAEYEETLMNENDALDAIKNTERFFSWVSKYLE
ncbi:MAG: HEPN domain-containing protein [Nanoarchaeota archaeon]